MVGRFQALDRRPLGWLDRPAARGQLPTQAEQAAGPEASRLESARRRGSQAEEDKRRHDPPVDVLTVGEAELVKMR